MPPDANEILTASNCISSLSPVFTYFPKSKLSNKLNTGAFIVVCVFVGNRSFGANILSDPLTLTVLSDIAETFLLSKLANDNSTFAFASPEIAPMSVSLSSNLPNFRSKFENTVSLPMLSYPENLLILIAIDGFIFSFLILFIRPTV